MVLRPLRRAPMMLGGVGFQAGLDEARQKSQAQQQTGPDLIEQLRTLKALLDDGALSPEEFELAKRKVLAG